MLAVALSLAIVGSVGVTAGVRTQASAGVVPIPSGEDAGLSLSTGVIDLQVIPSAALRYAGRRLELEARYHPRLLQRLLIDDPDAFGVRPLLLHQLSLAAALRFGRDVTWEVSGTAALGELDYAGALILAPELQGRTPADDVIGYRRYSGGTELRYDVDPRLRLAVGARAQFTGPTGDVTAALAFPESTQVDAELSGRFSVTRTHQVRSQLLGQWFVFGAFASEDPAAADTLFFLASPTVGWFFENSDDSASVNVGFAFASADRIREYIPLVDARMAIGVGRGRGWRLAFEAGAGHEAFPNVVGGSIDPQAFLTIGGLLTLRDQWRIRPSVIGYLVTTDEPREPTIDPARLALADTLIAATLPVTYAASDNLSVEVGARWSMRGPHYSVSPFAFGQLEFVGYVALVATFDTRL